MKHLSIVGLSAVLAVVVTVGGLLLIAAFARVDTYRGLPEVLLPPVEVLATKPGVERQADTTPAPGAGRI